jgi:hypothetical protein
MSERKREKIDNVAQRLRDMAATKNGNRTYYELQDYLIGRCVNEAKKGKYSLTIPFDELNATQGTIELWQETAKGHVGKLNVVIQTQDQENKELVIKWG